MRVGIIGDMNSHFNIFDELKEWSLSFPNWEQYALLLLCQKGSFDEEDKKSIYNEFKLDKELEVRTEEQQIYSLDDSSIPHSSNKPRPLILSRIYETIGINALVDDQSLSFGPKLNVIYGPNGSGKSGYARILKSASFTRSLDANLYGNVHILDSKPISATFDFGDGSKAEFTKGKPCTQLRDNFAVFDSSCIRVYTDSKSKFDVSPYGFDIFPALADVITFIKQELSREIQAKTPDIESFQILDSTTKIASILQTLNAGTNIQELEELQEFGENEEARIIVLETNIKELHRNDPKDIITKKRLIGKDIRLLTNKIERVNKALDGDKITAIEEKLKDIKTLRELSVAASASQFAKEPIQPIGTKTWKKLIEAAIAYNGETYPGKPFPVDSEDVRCVLCHQKLDVDAKKRLKSFFEFVHSRAEINLHEGLRQLTNLQKEVEIIDLAFIGENTAIYRTIKDSDETLLLTVKKHVLEAREFKESIIDNIRQETWNTLPERPLDVFNVCKNLRIKLAREIKCLRGNSVEKEISQKEGELKYLRDRKHLNKIFPKVKEAIVNYKWISKAQTITTPSPNHITAKRKELVEKLIGQDFITRFQDECVKLELKLPATTEVKIRGSSESTSWEHNMSTYYSNTPAPSQILSEGEQTIVALADFLTEINLNNTPLGIILDDPVNSMDHLRKELIANRLAKEATVRQVIIFTHDIMFVNALAQAAKELGASNVQFKGCTISVDPSTKTPGYIDKTLFPCEEYEKKSEAKTKNFLEQAKLLQGVEQAEKLILGCGALRAAYENFIQKQLFGDVIVRWREHIRATAVSNIYYDEQTNKEVARRYGALSRYVEAHSHSAEFHEKPLDCGKLEEELNEFNKLCKSYKKAADKFRQERSKEKEVFS